MRCSIAGSFGSGGGYGSPSFGTGCCCDWASEAAGGAPKRDAPMAGLGAPKSEVLAASWVWPNMVEAGAAAGAAG